MYFNPATVAVMETEAGAAAAAPTNPKVLSQQIRIFECGKSFKTRIDMNNHSESTQPRHTDTQTHRDPTY